MTKSKGFTLLEVLVALGVVAIISILSWQGLQEVLQSAKRVSDVDVQLQSTSAVFAQFEKDLAKMELGPGASGPRSDWLEITDKGLLIHKTQRNTSEPAYREEIEWVLEGVDLVRIAKRESDPREPSVSAPIAAPGMQIRLFQEPGGWSTPVVFGQHAAQTAPYLALQGSPLLREIDPVHEGQGTTQQVWVRAVEVSLTQANQQVVTKLLLTGGMY